MLKQTGSIAETIPAHERVTILERDINHALDIGDFRFQVGFYSFRGGGPACGCAIGAALHVLSPGPRPLDQSVREELEQIGFMTPAEIDALEDGYEQGKRTERLYGYSELFLELGKRLRARPDSTPACGK